MGQKLHVRLDCGHWIRDLTYVEAKPLRDGVLIACPACGVTATGCDVRLGGLSGRQSRRRLAARDANRALQNVEHFARPAEKDFD